MIVKKLMDIWKKYPINSFRTLLRKLDNDYKEFDNSTQKLINKTFTKSIKDDKVSLELKLKDDVDNEHFNNENSDEEQKEEKKETQISFTKDVLPYVIHWFKMLSNRTNVIPLTCILTIKNSNMDFIFTNSCHKCS